MIFLSLLAESAHSLTANWLRSTLAILGMVIGVASVIIMIAVGEGGQIAVKRSIESLGSNLLVMTPKDATGKARRFKLSPNDAELVREIPSVRAAAAVTESAAKLVTYGSNSSAPVLFGTTADYFKVRDWQLVEGDLPAEQAVQGNPRLAVIGYAVWEKLFNKEPATGKIIRIENVPFEVIAVLQKKGRNVDGTDQDDIVILPLDIAQKRILGSSQPNTLKMIAVKLQSGVSLAQGAREIRRYLRQVRRLSEGDTEYFAFQNPAELARSALETGRTMTLLLGSIASISLLVGGIGIMNIMYVCVTERTKEIGIRKSIGARRRDILLQFLLESVLISLIGCALGIGAGLLGIWIAKAYFSVPVALNTLGIAAAVASSVTIGLFFGYNPARKAARLLPVEALRYQ